MPSSPVPASVAQAMKKIQHMIEEVLRAKHVRLFILDSVDRTLSTVAETIDPATCQKIKIKKTFGADQGFAGKGICYVCIDFVALFYLSLDCRGMWLDCRVCCRVVVG